MNSAVSIELLRIA